MKKWESLLARFDRASVLILGDLILDQYIWGEVHRISPEAPIPVVEVLRETFSLGGAANVAHNARSLGARVEVCGVVGGDAYGRKILEMLREKGIGTRGVLQDPSRPTTLKTRIVAHRQQVVRVDREDPSLLEENLLATMKLRIREALPEVDAIVVEDYGKGVIQEGLLREIVPTVRKDGKIVTVDPKKDHFDLYRGVSAITPNRQEAELAAGVRISDARSLREAGIRLSKRLAGSAVLIKLGDKGMCLFEAGQEPFEIPAHPREVYDVSGAGDTVIAVFTTALVAGADLRQAATLSNLAGGLVVEKLGTATVTREEMRARLSELGRPG
ncbi:MAG: D-glycero-beta-D-manno-heptose-7-phosphate kinase [bacterium]